MKNKYSLTRISEILAVCIICFCVTLFFNLSSLVKTKVEENLQDNWRTSYDILVRPGQSASFMDYSGNRLIEPNFLSGQAGGITMEQYQKISSMDGVEVAAPIAMIGYIPAGYLIFSKDVLYQPDSPLVIYKDVMTVTVSDNVRTYTTQETTYTIQDRGGVFTPGSDPGSFIFTDQQGKQYQITGLLDQTDLTTTQIRLEDQFLCTHDGEANTHGFNALINLYIPMVGIDPGQEQTLVGLKDALTMGRYLDTSDQPSFDQSSWVVPALLNEKLYRNIQIDTRSYALQIPPGDTFAKMLQTEGVGYLESLPTSELLAETTIPVVEDYFEKLEENVSGHYGSFNLGGIFDTSVLPSPVEYAQTTPMTGFPLTLEAQPKGVSIRSSFSTIPQNPLEISYREDISGKTLYEGPDGTYYGLAIVPVGAFQLDNLPSNPLNQVPMETYSPPEATLRFDETGKAVDPVQILPTNNPTSYLSDTPTIFVSLESARFIAQRDNFISAVRVRVSGVSEISENTQERIEAVAGQIEAQTGLQVDITLGSSPQNVLVSVPGTGGVSGLGYVEEHWIRQLVGITIHREVSKEDLFLFLAIIICSLMYVVVNAKLNVVYQQKHIGILAALGWRPVTVLNESIKEFYLFSGLGVILSLATSAIFIISGKSEFSLYRTLLPIPVLLLVYLGGSVLEVWRLLRNTPVEIISVQNNTFVSQENVQKSIVGRNIRPLFPAGIAVTFSTSAFVFIIAVILQTSSQFEGSLLGNAIAANIKPFHVLLAGLSLLVSGLCVFETLLTRSISRRKEIGILKAIGWQRQAIFRKFFTEGLILNLISGAIGTALGLLLFAVFYDSLPTNLIVLVIIGLISPCVVGGLASLYPAYLAAQFDPNEILHS